MAFSCKYARVGINTGVGSAYYELNNPITSGVVVIEFDAKIRARAQTNDGIAVNATDPTTLDRIVGVVTRYASTDPNGHLWVVIYKDSTGSMKYIDTGIPADGSERHYKIQIDLDNKTIDVWIDSTQVVASEAYQGSKITNSNQVAAIEVLVGGSENTEATYVDIDNIVINQDSTTVYSEDFEDETVGQAPTGWGTYDLSGDSGIYITVEEILQPPPFTLSAGNEIIALVRCTPDGVNFGTCSQFVHPSILDIINKLPNGYEYIMAITPYPGGDARYENPSILFSNDLMNWSENGVTNPLANPPPDAVHHSGPHNADPCLVYDPINKEFRLYWAYWSDQENIKRWRFLRSKDGVVWDGPYDTNLSDSNFYWSFSILYDSSDGKWKAWGVKSDVSPFEVRYFESNDGITFTEIGKCNIYQSYNGQSWNVWHLEVRKVGSEFWMIAAMNPVGSQNADKPIHLFLFRSTDGVNWSGYSEPILTTENSLSDDRVYKSSFVIKNGTMHVIYSYRNTDGTWHIAYTYVDVSSITTDNSDNVITDTITGVPHFTTELDKTSVSVEANKTFSVTAKVTNNGSSQGNAEVRLKDHNGNIVFSTTVSVDAGSYSNVTLLGTAPSTQGTYQWTVETYNQTTEQVDDTDTLTVNVTAPPTKKEEFPFWIFLLLLIFFLVLLSRRRY